MHKKKFKIPYITTLVIALLFSLNSFAQIEKNSVSSGDWTSIIWAPLGNPSLTDNAVINSTVTIPLGTTVEINDLRIASSGQLIVNGNLTINGNLSMDNNSPEFTMGDEAIVTVIGDFTASNKIDISISSYLIIQGDFIKSGSESQGNLNVDDANIYIFGKVDGFPQLTSCGGTYDGTTTTTSETCDYGTAEDFVNNQENFPPEVLALINCFNLSIISEEIICSGSNVTFSIANIANVSYQWQVKSSSGGWIDISAAVNSSYTISNATTDLSGNKYRVVVKATPANTKNCKIGISNFSLLSVKDSALNISPIGGTTQICPETSGLTYSIAAIQDVTQYTWNIPSGWILNSGQNTNSITVTSGNNSGLNNISVSVTNSCGTVDTEQISVDIVETIWTGNIDTNWNNAGNWKCNVIPTASTNVLIPSGITNYPKLEIGSTGKAKTLVINAGASLIVANNTFEIFGIISNAGVFDALSGTISYNSGSAQVIPLNTFLNNRIKNLTIKNFAGVSISGMIEITGILKVESGTLTTGGNIKLISDATKTALIDGSGAGQISGDLIMQRFLDPAMGYKYFSTPFQNSVVGDYQNVVDLTASFPNFYRYVENRKDSQNRDASGFEAYTASTSAVNILTGYALNFGGAAGAKTVEISGPVNNGNQQISLTHNNGLYTKGFNLVGNPYPSPIDWNATSGWTKTNVDNAVYFFTASSSNQYTGAYSSFVNGISSTGSSTQNIIPSMQGFFVHVSDGTYPVSATLGTTNDVRVTDFSQEFYKNPEEESLKLIRLNAKYDESLVKDEAVIYFNDFASESFDKDYDALKLMNTDPNVPNFYSISKNSKSLSINAVSNLNNSEILRIPLGFQIESDNWTTISLETQTIEEQYIYLVDSEKKVIIDLLERNSYRFYASSGKMDKRFELVFSEKPINDSALIFNELFSVIQRDGSITIKMNLDLGKIGNIKVSTVTGQLIETQFVAEKDVIEINGIKSAGLYLVSFYSEAGITTKKILIQR